MPYLSRPPVRVEARELLGAGGPPILARIAAFRLRTHERRARHGPLVICFVGRRHREDGGFGDDRGAPFGRRRSQGLPRRRSSRDHPSRLRELLPRYCSGPLASNWSASLAPQAAREGFVVPFQSIASCRVEQTGEATELVYMRGIEGVMSLHTRATGCDKPLNTLSKDPAGSPATHTLRIIGSWGIHG